MTPLSFDRSFENRNPKSAEYTPGWPVLGVKQDQNDERAATFSRPEPERKTTRHFEECRQRKEGEIQSWSNGSYIG
jgi:hypothetical protein